MTDALPPDSVLARPAKLNVFISWSRARSGAIADLILEWAQNLVRDANFFLSRANLDGGTQWLPDLTGKMSAATFGLLVVTPENVNEPWLLFEAGAIWKAAGRNRCCPILCDLKPSDLHGPLAQFQAIEITSEQKMLGLVTQLIETPTSDARMRERASQWFRRDWGDFQSAVQVAMSATYPDAKEAPQPDLGAMIAEVLNIVRGLAARPERLSEDVIRKLTSPSPAVFPSLAEALGSTPERSRTLSELLKAFSSADSMKYDQDTGVVHLSPNLVARATESASFEVPDAATDRPVGKGQTPPEA